MLVKGCGKSLQGLLFSHLTWHHSRASLPQCFKDRVCRDFDRLYIPLASVWKSDHRIRTRKNVFFSSPLPVNRRGIFINLYLEKVRLFIEWATGACVWVYVHVCIFSAAFSGVKFSSSTPTSRYYTLYDWFTFIYWLHSQVSSCVVCLLTNILDKP